MTPRPSLTARLPWPWWISVLLAALVYWFLTYQAPELITGQPALARLLAAAPSFAPVLTIPILLLAAAQLYENSAPQNDPQDDGVDEPPVDGEDQR